jgi:hypothetical protein
VTVTDDEVNARMAWLGDRYNAKGFDDVRRDLLQVKELQAEIDWRLETRQLDRSHRSAVIDEVLAERRGGAAPGPTLSAGPPGFNADLNQRVLDRIDAEGLQPSDYPKVLDAMMRGE